MLNIVSFRAVQPAAAGQPAKLRVVRGHFGALFNRDLYCNGVPLAHMTSGRKLEIDLQPGWYRFAINPKQAPLELFLQAGSETRLISDSDQVYVVNAGKNEKGGTQKGCDRIDHLTPNPSIRLRNIGASVNTWRAQNR